MSLATDAITYVHCFSNDCRIHFPAAGPNCSDEMHSIRIDSSQWGAVRLLMPQQLLLLSVLLMIVSEQKLHIHMQTALSSHAPKTISR